MSTGNPMLAYDCPECGATYWDRAPKACEICGTQVVLRPEGGEKPLCARDLEPCPPLDMTLTVAQAKSWQENGLTYYDFYSPDAEASALAMIGVLAILGHKHYLLGIGPVLFQANLQGDRLHLRERVDIYPAISV